MGYRFRPCDGIDLLI